MPRDLVNDLVDKVARAIAQWEQNPSDEADEKVVKEIRDAVNKYNRRREYDVRQARIKKGR